jgi:ribosomal protein S27E
MAENKITKGELRDINAPDHQSLDPDRSWLRVACPQCGHELLVEAHEGGSVADCPHCANRVAYGGYVDEPIPSAPAADGATPVAAGDTATGADNRG